MTARLTPAPRREALGAVPMRPAGDTGNDANAASHYSTFAPPSIHHRQCSLLATWLHCRTRHPGYFTADAPVPQLCPACAGGRLQPMALCDLAYEAEPAGILRYGEG
jgi:hypothetical protein